MISLALFLLNHVAVKTFDLCGYEESGNPSACCVSLHFVILACKPPVRLKFNAPKCSC